MRIGQVDAWPKPKDVLTGFPSVSIGDRNAIMQQVTEVVRSRNISEHDHIDLVVLPESPYLKRSYGRFETWRPTRVGRF